jgi:hypothetical protein
MLAIYSNNYFTDEIIARCNFPRPYEIFRSIDQYVTCDSARKLAFINHLNQFDPPKDEQQRIEQVTDGAKFCQEIEQTKCCSEAVFAFDNEFHAYHFDVLKAHNQPNVHWILAVHSTMLNISTPNILTYPVQLVYQIAPYQKKLSHKLADLKHNVHKPFYFDALLGLSRPFRDFVFDAVTVSSNRQKFFMTYGRRPVTTSFSKYQWEPEVEFVRPFMSSIDQVTYLGQSIKLSLIVPITIYNQCAYSIITETNAFNQYSFFTEKIAKPLLAKRLFVVFTGYNFLHNLQKLGFRTFDNVIDESYDNILDDTERWTAAFRQVEKLCSMDQQTVYTQIQDIVEHNFQLLMNTNWNLLMFNGVKNIIDNLQPKIHNILTEKFVDGYPK